MQIHLVPPSVWAPQLAQVTARLDAAQARYTDAVLWTLQDAHVGITPALAASAAALMMRRTSDGGVWTSILRQLQEAVSPSRTGGVAVIANPTYFLFKVVKPLVREATRHCGECYLLCRDEVASRLTAPLYGQYQRRLEAALQPGPSQAGRNRLFRLEHGAVMAAGSAPSPHRRARVRLPEVDRVGVALLFGLPSTIPADRGTPRQVPTPTLTSRSRPSSGPHEAQIEGIRHTRKEADLGAMILSEYLMPPPLLMERMTNSGFFVYDRRPRREKLRDALLVGIMPHAIAATDGGAFIKACWADCMARVGRRLASARLFETEFRWIEGDAIGRLRQCSFRLDRLREVPIGEQAHDVFRRDFVTHLQWLPDYADAASRTDGVARVTERDPQEWAAAAWRSQHDQRADRFSFVHVMVCLPVPRFEQEPRLAAARVLGQMQAALGLGHHPRRQVSITYTPADIVNGHCSFGCLGQPYQHLGSAARREPSRLPAAVQTAWIDAITREIWHG